MKKTYLLLAILSVFIVKPSFAEEAAATTPAEVTEAAAPAADTTAVETAPTEAVTPATTTAIEPVAPAPVVDTPTSTAASTEAEISENLEFVSGEVSSVDAAAKTVTVKLYGENEDQASDKVLTVKTDDATDITDGDKDREIGSLTAGTEVDVEYDPASNKATYIFVY